MLTLTLAFRVVLHAFSAILRFTQRLTPVSGSCVANVPEIQSLFKRILKSWMEQDTERVKSSVRNLFRSSRLSHAPSESCIS